MDKLGTGTAFLLLVSSTAMSNRLASDGVSFDSSHHYFWSISQNI